MRRWLTILVVSVVILAGCQRASITESYTSGTPAHAKSQGEGVQEFQFYQYRSGQWVPVGDPFVVVVPSSEDKK